jgi:hypothetical protein
VHKKSHLTSPSESGQSNMDVEATGATCGSGIWLKKHIFIFGHEKVLLANLRTHQTKIANEFQLVGLGERSE